MSAGFVRLLLGSVLASLVLSTALAGPKIRVEQDEDKYKYEYDDGACHYKYEFNSNEHEEKLEQRGDCSALAGRDLRGRAYVLVPPGVEVIVLPPGSAQRD